MISQSSIPRAMIFIDGHYFEKHIKTKYDGEINYSQLVKYLCLKSQLGRLELIRCYFYDGQPDLEQNLSFLDEPEQTQRKNELQNQYQKKKDELEKIAMLDYFEVRKGKAVYNKTFNKKVKEEWTFRQKGVDSLIAIDMLTKAYQGQYNIGVLIAGDSDFIEIVKSVKDSGVRIMGAYFGECIPKELEYEFDIKFSLDDFLERYDIVKSKSQ